MRRVLFQVVLPVFFALEFRNEAVCESSLPPSVSLHMTRDVARMEWGR